MVLTCSFALFHFGSRVINRINNMRVARTPAQIALEAMRNLLTRRFWIALEKLHSRHDHARRAIPALQPVLFPKTFLHWMHLAILSQPLNGSDFATIRLDGQNRAGLHGLAIQQNCAGATDAGFAPYVCPGKFAEIAKKMNQKHPGFDFMLLLNAVDFYLNETLHMASENAINVWFRVIEKEY
jgi:hypothetical protein